MLVWYGVCGPCTGRVSLAQGTLALHKTHEKYDPVFMVWLGTWWVLVLCGHAVVHEGLVDNAAAFARCRHLPTLESTFHSHGVVFANGERWRQLRRFSLSVLRDFGMGRKSIESRIQEEAQVLLKELRDTREKPFDPTYLLSCAVSNIICSIVFGNRFDYRDSEFLELLRLMHESFWEEKSNPSSEFTLENLELTTLNLFFAGTETVSSTLRYGFLMLMKHPHVQEKVHEEIDQVIGRDRAPTLEDRGRMPYTDAVIHEIQRCSDLIPLNVPHRVTRDIVFRGISVASSDTDVYPLLSSVLHDPSVFKHPNAFNPTNFLDESGRFKRNDAFVPFSSGKRLCLGEGLARMELFLFLCTILQNLRLQPLQPLEQLSLEPLVFGFTKTPPFYQLCMVPR
ncbi:cytochrome P450 2G1-like protein [Columba livia]|nr:cytochrome P450 2G1-like protein [Columba livia]